ncbi:hypothetical protein ZWY2020_059014 [Hordeum vulgare]|nr:hypothetical protein ZWY2020_059014 [Hordeum vulgare]
MVAAASSPIPPISATSGDLRWSDGRAALPITALAFASASAPAIATFSSTSSRSCSSSSSRMSLPSSAAPTLWAVGACPLLPSAVPSPGSNSASPSSRPLTRACRAKARRGRSFRLVESNFFAQLSQDNWPSVLFAMAGGSSAQYWEPFYTVGAEIVRKSLSYPLKLIAENSDVNDCVVIEKVLAIDNSRYGYNAATGKYEDLMAAGIIDPTKVCDCGSNVLFDHVI